MRILYLSPLHLIILIIADSCLIITDCADAGRRRDENASTEPPTPRTKKARNVSRSNSTSGAATGSGSSQRDAPYWPIELNNDLLKIFYSDDQGDPVDWGGTVASLRVKYPFLPCPYDTMHHVHNIVQSILRNTPANGEGHIMWTRAMKNAVLKIYYQTIDGNPAEHANRMLVKWRQEFPALSDVRSKSLLRQAENMLIRNHLLKIPDNLSEERRKKIWADRKFIFTPELGETLCNVFLNMPPTRKFQNEKFYDELCRVNPIFRGISPRVSVEKARRLAPNYQRQRRNPRGKNPIPDEADEEADPLDQNKEEEQHRSDEYMMMLSHHGVYTQSSHDFHEGMGGSSTQRGSSRDDLDLDLRLSSLAVSPPRIHKPGVNVEYGISRIRHPNLNLTLSTPRTREPSVDLELNLSSQKKKGKSVLRH